jgi:hypothetical protein
VTTSLEARHKKGKTPPCCKATSLAGADRQQLVKPGLSELLDPLEELFRAVNEAMDHDAEDERRLYDRSATGRSYLNKVDLDNPLSPGPRRDDNINTYVD